ncbi:MAG: hypothetical protein JWM20_228 [Patescibacteria group bacterium]|nr:hypothetical protein [Patescibacteria group bacterium]
MNENPFEKLNSWLNVNSMTEAEKRNMRTKVAYYATTHPVKSGLMSPYGFRAAFAIIATLVLVLGGSVGVTQAASRSLPTSSLYPIKLWIEEFKASEQKTPEAVIAYETSRINTRFAEASQLAVLHQLNDQTSAVIGSGLAHSQEIIKTNANQIAASKPELALAAANSVETAYSSNGKVLSAIGRNTNQNLDTFILGAQISTESLALEKTHFEQIVATKPNDDTKSSAGLALAKAETALAKLPADAVPASEPAVVADDAAQTTDAVAATSVAPAAKMMAAKLGTPGTMSSAAFAPQIAKTPVQIVTELVAQAKSKMSDGSYSEALVILQKAQQIIDEANLTQSLETTYQVKTDVSASSAANLRPDAAATDSANTSVTTPNTSQAATSVTPTTGNTSTNSAAIPQKTSVQKAQ